MENSTGVPPPSSPYDALTPFEKMVLELLAAPLGMPEEALRQRVNAIAEEQEQPSC